MGLGLKRVLQTELCVLVLKGIFKQNTDHEKEAPKGCFSTFWLKLWASMGMFFSLAAEGIFLSSKHNDSVHSSHIEKNHKKMNLKLNEIKFISV